MKSALTTTMRNVARVETKIHLGGDAQVDDRSVAITPMNPMLTDPFLLLSEDWFSTTGFKWHPHRGFETVTLVLDGVLEHGDNLGNVGALTTGDIQWMTAGRGIIHRELAFRDERAHTLQLWLNLPAEQKMVETRYQDLRAGSRPIIDRDGVRIDVISGGVDGTGGPALNNWPIHASIVTLEPHRGYQHQLPAHDRAFFYVLAGDVIVGDESVRAGQIAWSDPVLGSDRSVMNIVAADRDSPSVFMVYSGKPIEEPVAMSGPFVMNTDNEIEAAFRDFHAGRFGEIPRLARVGRR